MFKPLIDIVAAVEEFVGEENLIRRALGNPEVREIEVKLLGQFSLLANPDVTFPIRATVDVDAWLTGDPWLRTRFIEIVKNEGFEFDHLSSEIWIPSDAHFLEVHRSEHIAIFVLDPLSAIVSKARYAPEKNRIVIRDAINFFGDDLKGRLRAHGINPEDFEKGSK